MSQQMQSGEEFRDGPPGATYSGYSGTPSYNTFAVPLTGQKLSVPHDTPRSDIPAVFRLALAIVSLLLVFLMFSGTLVVAFLQRNGFTEPVVPIAIFLALIFAVVTIIVNILFNRRR